MVNIRNYIFLIIELFLIIDYAFMKKDNFYITWANTQILLPKESKPSIDLSNNSLRQIVKISIGGEQFRLKLSNKYGNSPLEIKSLSIAKSQGQGEAKIDPITTQRITFNKQDFITIPKGEEIYSDLFTLKLASSSEVSISIFFGRVPSDLTGHKFSMTNSFIEKGNKINEEKFSTKNKVEHWYFISNVEVFSSIRIKGVVCFGDSITDGRFSSVDKQERWPDFLFKKLDNENIPIAINNQGLAGSFLTSPGIERFENDVIKQNGANYVIVLYGMNDITKLNKNENEIIDFYKEIIEKAHKANMLIYGGTLTPFKGYRLYSEERNEVRIKVNEWIRSSKKIYDGFDDIIDFDKVVRDSNDLKKLKDEYNSGDGVHLNSLGYEKMVEAFKDLLIFCNYSFNFD